jgi:hypothetical protein
MGDANIIPIITKITSADLMDFKISEMGMSVKRYMRIIPDTIIFKASCICLFNLFLFYY